MTTIEISRLCIDSATLLTTSVWVYYAVHIVSKHNRRLKFLQDQILQLREQVSILTRVQHEQDLKMIDLKKRTSDIMLNTMRKLIELPQTIREEIRKEMDDIIKKMP